MNLDGSQQRLSLMNVRMACGHKQKDPEMEKSLEFVGAEYDDLKGRYVEAKKDLRQSTW